MDQDASSWLAQFVGAGIRAQAAVDETLRAHSTQEPQQLASQKKRLTSTDVLNAWNALADRIPELPHARDLTKGRTDKVRKRIKEPGFDIEQILEKIEASDFLRGKNDRGWVVTFDFVIRSDETYTRILEGKYDNRSKGGRSQQANRGKYEGLGV